MARPDFIGVGMQKAGTRWLWAQLAGHPEFWMPPLKEFRFFGAAFPPRKGLEGWAAWGEGSGAHADFLRALAALERRRDHPIATYRSLFDHAQGRLTGEITPDYSAFTSEEAGRVRDLLGEVRVVLMVRDPIERAWSSLNDLANSGRGEPGAVRDPAALERALAEPGFWRLSRPSRALAAWSAHFPVRAFFFEDLVQRPEWLREEVATFLGARPGAAWAVPARANGKAGRARAPLTPPLRAVLAERFRDEILASAEVLGGPAAAWPANHGLA